MSFIGRWGKNAELEHRILELEEIVRLCNTAMDGIPINMLEKQTNWIPSDLQISRMRNAKDALRNYFKKKEGLL